VSMLRFTPGCFMFIPALKDAVYIMVSMQPLQDGNVALKVVDAASLLPRPEFKCCVISHDEYSRRPRSTKNEWVEGEWAFAKFGVQFGFGQGAG